MATSPSTKNYQIPTGSGTLQLDGEGSARSLGDISSCTIAPQTTKKDHFRHSGGRRVKDKTVVTQIGSTIKLTLDEPTAPNIAIWAQSDVVSNPDGSFTVSGMSNTAISGTLTITGDNEEGAHVSWTGEVLLSPSGDFAFITDKDDFNTVQLEGEVQADVDGNFGVWTIVEKA